MEGNKRHYWVFVNEQWVCDDRECDAVLSQDQMENLLNLAQQFFVTFEEDMEDMKRDKEALYGTDHSG